MARRIVALQGDDWLLGQAPPDARPESARWEDLGRVGEWLPATVPGNVRADLVRAGRIPDLAFGLQARESQWVDDHCWWLVRDLTLAVSAGERVHLLLCGVDYVSDLFFSGHHLGRHEGMFSPQVVEITDLLAADNRLAVRIVGSRWLPCDRSSGRDRLLNQIEARLTGLAERFPHRRDTLKCQMGFGWDFAPSLRTMGLWDEVYVVVSGPVFVRDVVAWPRLAQGKAALALRVELDAREGRQVRLRATLVGETFEAAPLVVEQAVDLPDGSSWQRMELEVANPRLWWPWDQGQPDLYRLVVEVWEGEQLLDTVVQSVGLREVALEGWTFYVNGRPVYARGASWVPADILPGRVGEAGYALLEQARRANMNMLRVWGGGLREKRAFYDLCDRLGILVWQEFPFACAFLSRYPRSGEYLDLVEAEASAIVRDLRNHACLALWCGGNEFSPQRNAPLVATLERVVQREDPTRPFLPASPVEGDSHNWGVWHHFEPPLAYRRDSASFASEFGLQAAPTVESLRRFIPQEDLWPPGAAWVYHGADLSKLWRYARPFLAEKEPSLASFVAAGQRAQAQGLQIAIEHYRRRKAAGQGGALVWQLNEPWPAISWALIDRDGQPKPAYATVKRLFDPLLVSLDLPPQRFRAGDRLRAEVWIINDRAEAVSACTLKVRLLDGAGHAVERIELEVDVQALSAEVVGQVDWLLPAGGPWRLECRLEQAGRLLTRNEYDLAFFDDIRPTPRQRLRAGLAALVRL